MCPDDPTRVEGSSGCPRTRNQSIRSIRGFRRAIALDGGMKSWRDGAYPLEEGEEPGLLI